MGTKTAKARRKSPREEALEAGLALHARNPLFSQLRKLHGITVKNSKEMGKNCAAYVRYCKEKKHFYMDSAWYGTVFLNKDAPLTAAEWAYTIAHCELHLAFGHFDAEKMPGYEKIGDNGKRTWQVSCDIRLWNEACDIYVSKFLSDIKFGKPTCRLPLTVYQGTTADERSIYAQLLAQGYTGKEFRFGTASPYSMDMQGLEHPAIYDVSKNERNDYSSGFAFALARSVSDVVSEAGGHAVVPGQEKNDSERAASWFINHYPLLGGLAAGFKIIESYSICYELQIAVAAVDVTTAEIYVNPAAGLSLEELKFVLAHEYLHAGLQHHERRQGRDPYLWNVACDFVINGWLLEMHVGKMPERGELYDETLRGKSAEEIYDRFLSDMRRFSKLTTFRGYGKGDIIGGRSGWGTASLDDFYKSALSQGLEYHNQNGRGTIPAGLMEEIRALAMPPIPWDVELGHWFDTHFSPVAAKRTYARPSRRQGSTPDIPRPRCVPDGGLEFSRTFGVVVDTSGSMPAEMIGYALGAIASYAAAKEVPYARVVFCDADAYDAGWITPEEAAGRVKVYGRGGTVLQPGVDLLLKAKDFPKDAPILIITDGDVEPSLIVKRDHAFLIPKGKRLPFRTWGKVFYFSE